MPQSPQERNYRLEVRAADEATEIHVLDGRLRTIAEGRGALEIDLNPGIYKVVGGSGDARFEKLVFLKDQNREIRIPKLSFSSPAPLAETRAFDQWVADDARRLSGAQAHHSEFLGQGSGIFFCVRDVPHPGDRRPQPGGHPMSGLFLCNAWGKKLVKLEDIAGNTQQWAARTISVAPGTWRLRLDLPNGAILEQVLIASEGWLTQVFLVRKFYDENPESYRADLANASIFLTLNVPGAFNPSDRDTRLTDLARQGLASGRQVLSDGALREIFEGKFRNPMLGILGAHLLLLERPQKLDPRDQRTPAQICRDHLDRRMKEIFRGGVTFQTLINNLRHLFNMKPHPDVEALALVLRDGARPEPVPPPPTPGAAAQPASVFAMPPMLHQSWSLIVQATAEEPALVPAGSVSSDVAIQVLNQNPWMLLWTPPDPAVQQQRIAQYRKAVASALMPLPLPFASAAMAYAPARGPQGAGVPGSDQAPIAQGVPPAPSKTMPAAVAPIPTKQSAVTTGSGGGTGGNPPPPSSYTPANVPNSTTGVAGGPASAAPSFRLPVSDKERQELVRMMGLPMSSIEQLQTNSPPRP